MSQQESKSESYVKCQGRGNGIARGWRQRSSNFYITINTNKTIANVYNLTDTEKAYVEKFEKVWKDFFDMPTTHYINIISREPSCNLMLRPSENILPRK